MRCCYFRPSVCAVSAPPGFCLPRRLDKPFVDARGDRQTGSSSFSRRLAVAGVRQVRSLDFLVLVDGMVMMMSLETPLRPGRRRRGALSDCLVAFSKSPCFAPPRQHGSFVRTSFREEARLNNQPPGSEGEQTDDRERTAATRQSNVWAGAAL